ncbi:MAG: hypothetical protein ABIN89_11675 [Chitinophagaceae bacterium]
MEVSEVKKIVDLWKEIHALLINKYTAQVADENAFLNFNALVEACEATEAKMKSSSQELTKYLENLFINVLEPLHNLQSEIAWDIATGYFADRIDDGTIGLRTNYLLLLNSLLETSCMERRERLSVKVVKQYAKRKPQRYYEDEKMYTQTVFNIIKDAGLFPVYHDTFKPLSLLDDYNEKLINLLIDSGHLKMAEKYCNEQIDGYYRQENSKVYLQLLKEIYKRENDNAKLLAILKELIPKTFNFDDFLFINEQLATEDERKKWRYKILSKADNKASYDPNALAFFFNLMNHEQKYKRMLEYIRENTPYSIIVKYAEKLAMADKKDFLTRIINKSDHWRDESKDKEHYPELLGILDKYYSRDQIEWEISELEKSRWNAGRNRFVVFFRKSFH